MARYPTRIHNSRCLAFLPVAKVLGLLGAERREGARDLAAGDVEQGGIGGSVVAVIESRPNCPSFAMVCPDYVKPRQTVT